MNDLNEYLRRSRKLDIASSRLEKDYCDPSTAPKEVLARTEELDEHGSWAIGRNDLLGWFITLSQGQGPVLVWSEIEVDLATTVSDAELDADLAASAAFTVML